MTPCARNWGSDGTLCSTHNGRFAAALEMRCDRAGQGAAAPEPLRKAVREFIDSMTVPPGRTWDGSWLASRQAVLQLEAALKGPPE